MEGPVSLRGAELPPIRPTNPPRERNPTYGGAGTVPATGYMQTEPGVAFSDQPQLGYDNRSDPAPSSQERSRNPPYDHSEAADPSPQPKKPNSGNFDITGTRTGAVYTQPRRVATLPMQPQTVSSVYTPSGETRNENESSSSMGNAEAQQLLSKRRHSDQQQDDAPSIFRRLAPNSNTREAAAAKLNASRLINSLRVDTARIQGSQQPEQMTGAQNHLATDIGSGDSPAPASTQRTDTTVQTREQQAPFPCSKCPWGFPTAQKLRNHMCLQHAIFECSERDCRKQFHSVQAMRAHMGNSHNCFAQCLYRECFECFGNQKDLEHHQRVDHFIGEMKACPDPQCTWSTDRGELVLDNHKSFAHGMP